MASTLLSLGGWTETARTCQASLLNSFAGTTTRWGHLITNSIAVQKKLIIFTADVSQAYFRGPTFEHTAKPEDESQRDVPFTIPPGSVEILKMVPGVAGFCPLTEVL